ncbi:MAG: endonuclease/exonuclease/phosphatase family protein [Muribaculaceae bacterium]|nr:endonuclease/exonuclease/phosphatase family protein [Muribaculaceae bacterium]
MLATKILSPFLFLAMRILSIIVYLATILAAFGGRMNPEYLTFPALMSLVFPFLAIFTIVLVLFWGLFRKIMFCGLGIGTIIICLTPMSVATPWGTSKDASENARTFKIISWNVLHTEDLRQQDYPGNRAIEYMIESGADIIGLAEMLNFDKDEIHNYSKALIDSLFHAYPYRAGINNKSDIKLLSKYPVESVEKTSFNDRGNCRYDFFKINFPEDRELIVAMVHLTSYNLSDEERNVVTEIKSMESAKTSMKEFKGSIRQKLREAFRKRAEDAKFLREDLDDISPDTPLIVCGDFNDVPTSWTYNIIKGDDLRDAYAETNFGPGITYNLHAFYFHIDQMLYRGPLKALDLTIGKINSSDHYPLIGEFEFTNSE